MLSLQIMDYEKPIEFIKRGEQLGYIVLPYQFNDKNTRIMNKWFDNRCRHNKPYIVIMLKPDGKGHIQADLIPTICRSNAEVLHEELMDTYIALPRVLTKGLYTRFRDYWFKNNETIIHAAFPAGDTTILKCILDHLEQTVTSSPEYVNSTLLRIQTKKHMDGPDITQLK